MASQVPPPNSSGQPSSSDGGGHAAAPKEIVLARWVDRFIAWLIDFVIVNVALWIVFGLALATPFILGMAQMMVIDRQDGRGFFFDSGGPGGGWGWLGGFVSGEFEFFIKRL